MTLRHRPPAPIAPDRTARRQHHGRWPSTEPAPRFARLVGWLGHRWPTWLALAMTVDNWFDPAVPSPWLLLILPGGYLIIGAWRRTLGDRRVLTLQVGALLGYLALALVATAVADDAVRYLVAAGWLFHAGWDLVHHRRDEVVPRAYAEWCGVIDLVIGITILASW